MAELVYVTCALVSLICAILLTNSYRSTKAPVLLWVAASFWLLVLNNTFVCVDLVLFADLDLWGPIVRSALLAVSGTVLVFGLVWEVS